MKLERLTDKKLPEIFNNTFSIYYEDSFSIPIPINELIMIPSDIRCISNNKLLLTPSSYMVKCGLIVQTQIIKNNENLNVYVVNPTNNSKELMSGTEIAVVTSF